MKGNLVHSPVNPGYKIEMILMDMPFTIISQIIEIQYSLHVNCRSHYTLLGDTQEYLHNIHMLNYEFRFLYIEVIGIIFE